MAESAGTDINEAIFFRGALRILSWSADRFFTVVQHLFSAFKPIYRRHYIRDTIYR